MLVPGDKVVYLDDNGILEDTYPGWVVSLPTIDDKKWVEIKWGGNPGTVLNPVQNIIRVQDIPNIVRDQNGLLKEVVNQP